MRKVRTHTYILLALCAPRVGLRTTNADTNFDAPVCPHTNPADRAIADRDRIPDRHANPYRIPDRHTDSDRNANGDAHRDRHANPYRIPDRHTDSDRNANGDAHRDRHANPYRIPDGDVHRESRACRIGARGAHDTSRCAGIAERPRPRS